LAAVCIIAVLVASVYVGASSPDWTPFESPSFTAVRYSYDGLVEANKLVSLLPPQLTFYPDYDVPLNGMANLAGLLYRSPQSYQTTRNIIDSVKTGAFNPLDSTYVKENLNAIYVIRPDEVQNASAINTYMNTLYNSGIHVLLKTP
jgi:hypothetical protein